MGKKRKEKEEEEGKKKKDDEDNIFFKNHRVKIRNCKAKKHCEENVICWKIEWTYKKEEF